MIYAVEFTKRAAADFDEALQWYRIRSLEAANKWIVAIERALDALERNPEQFPIAQEDGLRGLTLRDCAIGGGRRITHRMIFAIRPSKVVVYTIWHTSRGDLTLEELL
jgi:plasmid stabilization system protein ParE